MKLPADNPRLDDIVPAPRRAKPKKSENFALSSDTSIAVRGDEARAAGEYVADTLRKSTGYELPVTSRPSGPAIELSVGGSGGPESYRLDVKREGVAISAADKQGLFNGAHSLRQLLPPDVESSTPAKRKWVVAGGTISDKPRFAYRGAMLDVARHFFGADTVKRHIDRVAAYKVNHLHLHLSDDQGWRLEIKGWPKLTSVGSKSEAGGGRGGFYTQEQFRDIVSYAASRGVTIVPEIDMPGHTNAALTSYPELTCDGKRPPPYTGTQVGFSTLCVSSEKTYRFARDVISQVAELTPGPYLHIGGDEAESTTDADYRRFFSRVLPMVTEAGKRPVGWHEYAKASLPRDAVVQYWRIETSDKDTAAAAKAGHDVIMSPASKAYLDMKHAESDPVGNKWAGAVSVRSAYDWEPTSFLSGVPASAVKGIEAPLWTELVSSESDVERQAFPRTAAVAEVGWSEKRDWSDFRRRLAQQGPRLEAQGVAYHRASDVPW